MSTHKKQDGTVTVKGGDGRITGNISAGALAGPGTAAGFRVDSGELFDSRALEWAFRAAGAVSDGDRAVVRGVLAGLTVEQQVAHHVSSAGQRSLGKTLVKAVAAARAADREGVRAKLRAVQVQRRFRGHDFYPPKAEWARIPTDISDEPLEDQVVHAHYFVGGNDWWVQSVDDDGVAFGFVRLAIDPDAAEWGEFDLRELETVRAGFAVERELDWAPVALKDVPSLAGVFNRNFADAWAPGSLEKLNSTDGNS